MSPDMAPDVTTPEEFTANIRRETAALSKVIRERGIIAGYTVSEFDTT